VVQVLCTSNTLQKEQAPVELKLYANHVVFHKDETIATTQVDAIAVRRQNPDRPHPVPAADVSKAALAKGSFRSTIPTPGSPRRQTPPRK